MELVEKSVEVSGWQVQMKFYEALPHTPVISVGDLLTKTVFNKPGMQTKEVGGFLNDQDMPLVISVNNDLKSTNVVSFTPTTFGDLPENMHPMQVSQFRKYTLTYRQHGGVPFVVQLPIPSRLGYTHYKAAWGCREKAESSIVFPDTVAGFEETVKFMAEFVESLDMVVRTL